MKKAAMLKTLGLITLLQLHGFLAVLQTRPSSSGRRHLDRQTVEFIHPKFAGHRLARNADGGMNVLITYRNARGKQHAQTNLTAIGSTFDRISTIAGVVSIERLQLLMDDEDILEVAEDAMLYAADYGEAVPYGLSLVEYREGLVNPLQYSQEGDCEDPSSFKIGIVDGGVDALHPDLPCLDSPWQCKGIDLGGGSWDSPVYYHGVHVTGIIAALANNGQGVRGIIGDGSVCLLFARVLDDNGSALLSRVLDGAQWVYNQGAQVINLSVEGGSYVTAVNDFFDEVRANNVLVFAAAGNTGELSYAYPASYESVISVAAVDESLEHVWFSNQNDRIDLSAPGLQVLSTAPIGRGNVVALITIGDLTVSGKWIQRSTPQDVRGKVFFECPDDMNRCIGPGDHICIVTKEGVNLELEGRKCQLGGGVGVVLRQRSMQRLGGKLKVDSDVTIPVAIVNMKDGKALLQRVGESGDLLAADGYMYLDGTSMASPLAAGAAAAVWRSCSSCSADDVDWCLRHTALDLGEWGRDESFGNGLIQVESAHKCLQQDIGCC